MNKSVYTAIAIAVVATAWIASGQLDLRGEEAGANVEATDVTNAAPAEQRLVSVRTILSKSRPYQRSIVVRGVSEAMRTVELKAETFGRVEAVHAEEGDRVEVGDLLVTLAADDRLARKAEAEALLKQRQLEYKANQSLRDKGFRAETQLAAAKAALDAAKAQLERIEVELGHLAIGAPFAGVLERRHVEVGDYLQEADPVARIVDEDPFLVVAQVSERQVGSLSVGGSGVAQLATGQDVAGRVRFIGTEANVETRTFRIELEVPNPDGLLRAGVTAEIRFQTGEVMGHHVSPAVLTLNDNGRLGVRVVDDDAVVRFVPVEIIGDTENGVWLQGLPDEVQLITVGQEYVTDGQTVKPVPEQPGGTS